MTGYKAFAQSGVPLTWDAMAYIETNALVRGGMAADVESTVTKAIQTLREEESLVQHEFHGDLKCQARRLKSSPASWSGR